MSQTLRYKSIILIGKRFESKLVWIQLYDATEAIEEEALLMLLGEIKIHILKKRVKSGAARKFLDGKLIYYELSDISAADSGNVVYCLFTQEQKITPIVKKAIQAIAERGGSFNVYSAKRFFREVMDLIANPEGLEKKEDLDIEEALDRIENYHSRVHDVNELGYLVSLLDRSTELDQGTLEMIYLHVYESIHSLVSGYITSDPDEFLDAAFILARRFQQIGNFHLALELYKNIIPVAEKNERYDLETNCRIRICTIYKLNFPQPGEYILDILSAIKEIHLQETAQTHREIYYCLLGFANDQLNNPNKAIINYNKAIAVSDVNIGSPEWIAEAYDYLAQIAHNKYYLIEASRHYLTAATIAFSSGDLTLADNYRNNAAGTEIHTSFSLIHTALILRMEGNLNDAEYRAWDALRYLIRALTHSKIQSYPYLMGQAYDILNEADVILAITGKKRKNTSIIRKVRNTLQAVDAGEYTPGSEGLQLEKLARLIEENIPLPPPTFMLLTLDGRLVLMGKISAGEWQTSDLEGVILSGILSAIMSLITEVTTGKTSLRTVDAGSFQIMIEQSENVAAVLVLDRDIPELRQKLRDSLNHVDEYWGERLKYWDGNMDGFEEMKSRVVQVISGTQ
ncbi:MAG: hypothetical protein ACW98K_11450 [Candidatus Kariarchaeaceae archaeon]